MNILQQKATDYLASRSCRGRWIDRGDPVCQVHGHLWPDGRQWCNGADSDALDLAAAVASSEGPVPLPEGLRLEFERAGCPDPSALFEWSIAAWYVWQPTSDGIAAYLAIDGSYLVSDPHPKMRTHRADFLAGKRTG